MSAMSGGYKYSRIPSLQNCECKYHSEMEAMHAVDYTSSSQSLKCRVIGIFILQWYSFWPGELFRYYTHNSAKMEFVLPSINIVEFHLCRMVLTIVDGRFCFLYVVFCLIGENIRYIRGRVELLECKQKRIL